MIELLNVSVRFGLYHLHEVTASIESGEYFVVTGPAGSGKTVLLETLIGLNAHYRGRMLIDGRNMRGVPVEARSIAYVPQDYGVFPHLSVRANLLYGARERGLARENVLGQLEELLDRFDLRSIGTRTKVTGLSAGEQQKIAIVRALLSAPAALVLDEPLAFLDEPVRRELMLELKRINEELGVTIVHATRNLDEALALGRRVAVLVAGRMHQVTRLDGPYLTPADAVVAQWAAGRNVFPAVVKSVDESGSTAAVTCGEAELVGGFRGIKLAPQMAVLVCVRAQDAFLVGEGSEAQTTNVLDATVEAVLSYGGTETALVAVPKMDQKVEVAVARVTAAALGLAEGTRVRLAIPAERLWILPRQ
jgi:ABC-type Fe3+/spermidine/putrescine transport system ATPase subunit